MLFVEWLHLIAIYTTVASFTKEVDPQLAKRILETNESLANLELTSLVKEAKVLGGAVLLFLMSATISWLTQQETFMEAKPSTPVRPYMIDVIMTYIFSFSSGRANDPF